MAAPDSCPGAVLSQLAAKRHDVIKVKEDQEYFTFIDSFIPRLTFIRKVYCSNTEDTKKLRVRGLKKK